MKNLQTFEEFMNESSDYHLNENLTVKGYIDGIKNLISRGREDEDTPYIGWAMTACKILKSSPDKTYWVNEDSDDPKFESIQDYYNANGKDKVSVSNKFGGEDAFHSKSANIIYFYDGTETYILPISVYDKI